MPANSLRDFYRWATQYPAPNLVGDRDIEYSWIVANMPHGKGKALDFGSGPGWLSLLAARRGFDVLAIDLLPVRWSYEHKSLRFKQGNLFDLDLPANEFSLIMNCSAVEHVGLHGRYETKDSESDGDLRAMKLMNRLMKKDGVMLLTIPVGRDRVFSPLHRVYGEQRLPKLLDSWKIEKKEYWLKNEENQWIVTNEHSALRLEPTDHYYALGLFVLIPRKSKRT